MQEVIASIDLLQSMANFTKSLCKNACLAGIRPLSAAKIGTSIDGLFDYLDVL